MARPQKFRHQREELSDPKVFEKLGRFVIEIEELRSQKSKIDELLAAAFDAVDDGGFEKKFVRKVVALRAKEDGIRRDEEDGLECYEFAIEKGVSLARSRRKPANDQFDPITGEFIDDGEERRSDAGLSIVTKHTDIQGSPETAKESPRKAAEAVSERTATQVDASASSAAGVSGQPEIIPASSAESAGEGADSALPAFGLAEVLEAAQ